MKSAKASRPIALIGPMGAGKTATAKCLAALIGWHFIDLDDLVVRKSGKAIERIFSEDGEEEFRRLESEALMSGLAMNTAVIACGGGVVVDRANVELLKSSATVVYLKVDIEVAVARVGNDSDRPLAPLLEHLVAERDPLYAEAAHFTVEAGNNVDDVAESVRRAIGIE